MSSNTTAHEYSSRRKRSVEGIIPPQIGCDNMGVVKHAQTAQCPLLEKQVQAMSLSVQASFC